MAEKSLGEMDFPEDQAHPKPEIPEAAQKHLRASQKRLTKALSSEGALGGRRKGERRKEPRPGPERRVTPERRRWPRQDWASLFVAQEHEFDQHAKFGRLPKSQRKSAWANWSTKALDQHKPGEYTFKKPRPPQGPVQPPWRAGQLKSCAKKGTPAQEKRKAGRCARVALNEAMGTWTARKRGRKAVLVSRSILDKPSVRKAIAGVRSRQRRKKKR